MHALALLSHHQFTKFEVPSYTYSKQQVQEFWQKSLLKGARHSAKFTASL